jgi:RNA 2',3'-cyclic 3'-phosphodiesterase
MAENARIRAFLAIDLSRELVESLAALQEKLRDGITGARWVKPQGIHLTLKFLGETPKSKLDRIGEALPEWLEDLDGYQLTPDGLGVFPSLSRPRVLWIGFRNVPEDHVRLTERVHAKLSSFGFAREKRKDNPHLTIARFRERIYRKDVASAIGSFQQDLLPPVTVQGVTLFQSVLSPRGAVYTRLNYSPFKDRGGKDEAKR